MKQQQLRQVVLVLLDHWPDFFAPWESSGNVQSGESGGGLALVSAMSRHPAVVELERCLRFVRSLAKNHYRYVVAYFDAEWRIAEREVRRRTVSGRRVVETRRVRERVLPRELQQVPVCPCGCTLPRPVCLAVDVICLQWSLRVVPEAPVALNAKLTTRVHPETGEQVWTERRVA